MGPTTVFVCGFLPCIPLWATRLSRLAQALPELVIMGTFHCYLFAPHPPFLCPMPGLTSDNPGMLESGNQEMLDPTKCKQ